METIGFLTAMGAALAWGSYNVPFKKSPSVNIIQFQALMSVGAFLFALIAVLAVGYSFKLNSYAFISGVLWAIANAISLIAINNIGLSKAAPIWMSMVITVSFLWGVFLFNELPSGLLIGSMGIILIILGVFLVSKTDSSRDKNTRLGILASLLAGSLFGSYFVPIKLGNLKPEDTLFPMSLGVVLFGIGFFFMKRIKFKKEAIFNSVLSGVVWNIGNLFSFFAVALIGLAKAFPMTQGAVLVAVCWGLFYFKESSELKHKVQILIGAIILLIGVITLSSA